MKRLSIILLFLSNAIYAQNISGKEILKRIDSNMALNECVIEAEMVIHARTGTRKIGLRSYLKGKDKAFVEYLSPTRERGKKMLKLENKIWNYFPEPMDRIITISGHLLKQSVMGSDLSYEDMTENDELLELYDVVVEGKDTINNSICIILKLEAKSFDVVYQKRKMWVDSQKWVPIRENLYAKSGKLLKEIDIEDVMKVGKRWYPSKMVFKDALTTGKGTEYIIKNIELTEIPDFKFTKAALRR